MRVKNPKLFSWIVFLSSIFFSCFSSGNDVRNFYDLGSYPVLVHLSLRDFSSQESQKALPDNFFTHFFHRSRIHKGHHKPYRYSPFCSTVYIVSSSKHFSLAPAFGYHSMTPLMLVDHLSRAEPFVIEPLFFSGVPAVYLIFHAAHAPHFVLSSIPVYPHSLLLLKSYRSFDTRQMWIFHANQDESVSLFSAYGFGRSIGVSHLYSGLNLFLTPHGYGQHRDWRFLDAKTQVDCTQYLLNLFVQPYFLDLQAESDRWLRLTVVTGKPLLSWHHFSDIEKDMSAPQFVLSRSERMTKAVSFNKKWRLSNGECLIPSWNAKLKHMSLYSLSCVDRHASAWRYGIFDRRDKSATQLCALHGQDVFCLGVSSDVEDDSVVWLPEKIKGKVNTHTIFHWRSELHKMILGSSLIGCTGRNKEFCSLQHPILVGEKKTNASVYHLVWLPSHRSLFFSEHHACLSALSLNKPLFLKDCSSHDRTQNWLFLGHYWKNRTMNGCVDSKAVLGAHPKLLPCPSNFAL